MKSKVHETPILMLLIGGLDLSKTLTSKPPVPTPIQNIDDLILNFKLPEIFWPSFTVQDFMTIMSIYRFFRHFRLLLKRHTDRAKVVYTSLSSRLSQFVRVSLKFCHNWFLFFEDDGRFSDPKPPAEEEPDQWWLSNHGECIGFGYQWESCGMFQQNDQ